MAAEGIFVPSPAGVFSTAGYGLHKILGGSRPTPRWDLILPPETPQQTRQYSQTGFWGIDVNEFPATGAPPLDPYANAVDPFAGEGLSRAQVAERDKYGRILSADEQARIAEQGALATVFGGVLAKEAQAKAAGIAREKQILKRSEELRRQRAFRARQAWEKFRGFGKAFGKVLLPKVGGVEGVGQILARRIPGVLLTSQAAQLMQILGDAYQEHAIRKIAEQPRAELSDYAKAKIAELERAGTSPRAAAEKALLKRPTIGAKQLSAAAAPRARPPVERQEAALKQIAAQASPATAGNVGPQAPATAPSAAPSSPGPRSPSSPSFGKTVYGVPAPARVQFPSVWELAAAAYLAAPRGNELRLLAPQAWAARQPVATPQAFGGRSFTGFGASSRVATRCQCKPCRDGKRRVGKRRAVKRYKCLQRVRVA